MADFGLEALISALTSAGADAALTTGVDAAATAGAQAVGDAALGSVGGAALGGGLDAAVSGALGGAANVGDALISPAAALGEAGTSALGGALSVGDASAGGIESVLGGAGIVAPPDVTTIAPPTVTPELISQPASLGGASAVGGPPTGGAFDVASGLTTSGAPGAPGAVAPAGGVGAGSDLTSKAVGGAGSAAPSGGKSFLDTLTDSATKNALPAAIAAGGLGYNILQGNKKPPAADAMAGTAAPAKQLGGELAGQGKSLTQYLEAGTLPANMQTSLDEAVKSAKTKAVSNAAAQGLPTDPTKNTALQQALQKIDQDAITTKAQLGQQLLQSGQSLIDTGLKSAGMSTDIYNKLVGIDQAEQKQIQDAIANFAKAVGGFGGGTKGLNIKVA